MEERKPCTTFSKVTALLCALVVLFGIIAFFGSNLMEKIDGLNDLIEYKNEQITDNEERIVQLNEDIAIYQKQTTDHEALLADAEEDLQAAAQVVATKVKALQKAEDDLDEKCSRSYYSYYSCSSSCKSLHNAVSAREDELSDARDAEDDCQDAVDSCEYAIERLADDIATAKKDIETAEDRIEELKDEIKETEGKLAGAWFVLILKLLAMLLAVGGLVLLIKNFSDEMQDNLILYAVAGLAASSFLFLIVGAVDNEMFENSPLGYLLLSPYAWNVAVMALLAAVLLQKTEKPVVLRNIAVVLLVIVGVLLIVHGAPLVGVLYAAAMICTAFVIVPLVFTEYIDIAKHIFLSLITFGIWQLVWTYHVTKNLNKVEAVEERRPVRELLLCMFLAFYYPYWLYKTAEGVEDYGMEKGKEFKIDILCIAFSFVCPLYATILIQNKINVVAGKPVCTEAEVPAAE